ncbi:adenosine receptor A2b-like [Stylophora pistillata]|uniref:adenosine receptor A2b-like n=1 Tax=Stylophora pistillata TaxID=50429 RepID=UPI000C0575B4|nr:adenosine receptor A2b-like [Stylophora pistillata]
MDFSSWWNVFWTVTYSLIAVVITTSNLATIMIFVKRKLLDRARYLILSLTVADTFVGTLSVPLWIAVGFYEDHLLSLVFQCTDIFTGVVSIFTLASISLERMHAILWPLHHRTLTLRFYTCVIGIPWIFGLVGMSCRFFSFYDGISWMGFTIIINVLLLAPLLITIIAYVLIWRKQRHRLPNEVQVDDRDKKLAKTLRTITGAFILTWGPHQVINTVFISGVSIRSWPYLVFHIMKIMQFINSFINVVVYSLRIPEFREALYSFFL